MSVCDEDGIEDVDLCFVDEEGFKEEGDEDGAFREDEDGAV